MVKYSKFLSLCVIYLISRNILFSEITANNAYKLFPTVYDQAQTVYDYPFFSKPFKNLGSDYFYVGSHIDKLSNYTKGAYIDLKAGYYKKEDDTPFSITGKFFISPNVMDKNLIDFTNTGIGITNFKYKNIPYYSIIGGELNFLINIKDILSTGIYASFSYNDKSFISTNMKYMVNNIETEEYNSFNKNASFYELNLKVPVYFRINNFKHYFEIGFDFKNTMVSNGNYSKQLGMLISESNRYESLYTYTPSLMYRFGYVLSENTVEFQTEAKFAINLLKQNLALVTKSFIALPTEQSEINIYSNTYNSGFNFNVKAGFMLQFFAANDYVKLRIFPSIGYSLELAPYISSSKYLTTGLVQRSASFNKQTKEMHSVSLYAPIALNIYNKNWPIGVIFALDAQVTYNYTKFQTEIYTLGTRGQYTNMGYFKDYSSYFEYTLNPQVGIYFPFDNSKLLQTSLNFKNDFSFESFDIVFSMPISRSENQKFGSIVKPIKKEKPKDIKNPKEEKVKKDIKSSTPKTESIQKGLDSSSKDTKTPESDKTDSKTSTVKPPVPADESKDKNKGFDPNGTNKGEILDIPFIGKIKRMKTGKLSYKL